MTALRIAGIVLILAGLLALVYGGFSYTKSTREVDLGPLELEAKRKERVEIPAWAGVATVIAGIVLLVVRKPR
ncbi:MAG: hypothetical protein ACRD2J_09480 [Thermoanaerobaculia bacterium]